MLQWLVTVKVGHFSLEIASVIRPLGSEFMVSPQAKVSLFTEVNIPFMVTVPRVIDAFDIMGWSAPVNMIFVLIDVSIVYRPRG